MAKFDDYRKDNIETLAEEEKERLLRGVNEEMRPTKEAELNCMREYSVRMGGNQPARGCACCGRMDVPLDESNHEDHAKESKELGIHSFTFVRAASNPEVMTALQYTVEETRDLWDELPVHIHPKNEETRSLWRRYRKIRSNVRWSSDIQEYDSSDEETMRVTSDGNIPPLYHLYPELCSGSGGNFSFYLCDVCSPDLLPNMGKGGNSKKKKKSVYRPFLCIASGFDLGMPERADLPPLSFLGEIVLARTRVLSCILNIKMPLDKKEKFVLSGHVICLPENAPVVCSTVLPTLQFIKAGFQITLEGSTLGSRRIHELLKRMGAIQVEPKEILDWLNALRFVNKDFKDLQIQDEEDVRLFLDQLRKDLTESFVQYEWPDKNVAKLSEKYRSDVAFPEDAVKEENEDDIRFDCPRVEGEEGYVICPILLLIQPSSTVTISHSFGVIFIFLRWHKLSVLFSLSFVAKLYHTFNFLGLHDSSWRHFYNSLILCLNRSCANEDFLSGAVADTSRHLESFLLTCKYQDENSSEEKAAFLSAVSKAFNLPGGSGIIPSSDGFQATVRTEGEMKNIYEEMREILVTGFPCVFPLGTGIFCGQTGPLDRTASLFLLKHFSGRPSRDARLLHALHNMKMRQDAGRVTAALARTDGRKMSECLAAVTDENFEAKLHEAMRNPNSAESMRLTKGLMAVMLKSSARVPYSALERGTSAVIQLVNMVRFYGEPNSYLTIGFDVRNNTLMARLALGKDTPQIRSSSVNSFWSPGADNEDEKSFKKIAGRLPGDFVGVDDNAVLWRKKLETLVANNHGVIALVIERARKAILNTLFGVSSSAKISPKTFSSQKQGLMGRAHAFFSVYEGSGKKLHAHAVIWGSIPHFLTQILPGRQQEVAEAVLSALNSCYSAVGDPRVQVAEIVRRVQGGRAREETHPGYFLPPDFSRLNEEDVDRLRSDGSDSQVIMSQHAHLRTCHMGPRGLSECRLCYGRAYSCGKGPQHVDAVIVRIDRKTNVYPFCHEKIQRPQAPAPMPELCHVEKLQVLLRKVAFPCSDSRLLFYDLFRPPVSIPSECYRLLFPNAAEGPALQEKRINLMLHQIERLAVAMHHVNAEGTFDIPNMNGSATIDQCKQCIAKIQSILGFIHVGEEDSTQVFSEDRILCALQDTFSTEAEMLLFIELLGMMNSLLGESLPLLDLCHASPCNVQPITSSSAAMNIVFYLIDYITKETMTPKALLSFVSSAIFRFKEYKGKAPEGQDILEDLRPERRFIQILLNGINGSVEYNVHQCALNVARVPAHESSDWFEHVYTYAAIALYRAKSGIPLDDIDPGGAPEGVKGEIIDDDYILRAVGDVDIGGDINTTTSGKIMRDDKGKVVILGQQDRYYARGKDLAFLSLLEYACLVKEVVPADDKALKWFDAMLAAEDGEGSNEYADSKKDGEDEGSEDSDEDTNDRVRDEYDKKSEEDKRNLDNKDAKVKLGRKKNFACLYHKGYAIRNTHYQRLASRRSIPILGTLKSVPTFTNLLVPMRKGTGWKSGDALGNFDDLDGKRFSIFNYKLKS